MEVRIIDRISESLGNGPYPFNTHDIYRLFHVGTNDRLMILRPKENVTFNLEFGSHSHSDYEFLFPITPMPYVGVENETIKLAPRSMLPFNSEQFHGPNRPMPQLRFTSLSISKRFLNEVANMMIGRDGIVFSPEAIYPSEELKYMLGYFIEESSKLDIGSEFILDNLSMMITVEILRSCKSNRFDKREIPSLKYSKEKISLKKVIDVFNDCYYQDFRLEDVAKLVNLSPYYFIRLFKNQTGMTPFEYLLQVRLDRASEMLRKKEHSITEICYSTGFKNSSHFSKTFKKRFGLTPSEFKQL